jgi:ATP-binding protein involved in chromosome partitioning
MSEVIAQIPLVQAVREAGDNGKPAALGEDKELASTFDKMTDRFLQQVKLRHELYQPTRKVEIKT